jgi:hypothetical protein
MFPHILPRTTSRCVSTLCDVCRNFDKSIDLESEYLRLQLHLTWGIEHTPQAPTWVLAECLVLLDCMHTYWVSQRLVARFLLCARRKKPPLYWEAVADYHLWFWHASYGYLEQWMTDFSTCLLCWSHSRNGAFIELEETVVPYVSIRFWRNHACSFLWMASTLYSRLWELPEPCGNRERSLASGKEAAERMLKAFGVFQVK